MTERDAFEARFGAAVRGYAARVSSDLDPVELAHRIAAMEPRRHGFAAALGWRRVAISRVAWVLLLLAALLIAVVVGMLVVGSQPVPKLPAVIPPVGPVFACPPGSTPDQPGPVDQARPPQAYPEAMAFDRHVGRIVLVTPGALGAETWVFDVCTNTWTQMHPKQEPDVGVVWGAIVYDVDSDVTIASVGSRTWAYDLKADSWTEKGAAPYVNPLFYDPVSGLVVATGDDRYPDTPPSELLNYDVETDTWTPIHQANGPAIGSQNFGLFAYDASVDRIVANLNFGGESGAKTWLFDIRTGTWSKTSAVTPGFGVMAEVISIAYDEAAKLTVIAGNRRLAAYDETADRWEILVEVDPDQPRHNPWGVAGPAPASRWATMVYDPVNERLVGRGLYVEPRPTDNTPFQFDDVVAFDLVTREWTVLLESGDGQPAPSAP